jgi:hypothetical protein
MKRPTWLLVGVAVIVLLLVWIFLRRGGGEHVAVDLIQQFPTAKEKRPNPEVFSVVDATLSGQARKAVLVKDPSRLVYSVTVPDNAELHVSLGMLEEAWTTQGDGVVFRILVGAGGNPEELLNLNLNPFANPSDRGWHDLTLDLSEYAGESVDLFFNTNSSPPSRPAKDDRNGDLAVWGAPRIVTH